MRTTNEDLRNAGDDARALMENSPTIRGCVAIDMLTRNIYILVQQIITTELTEEWEVARPDLVLQTLTKAAEGQAKTKPMTVTEMLDSVNAQLLPVLEHFRSFEKDNGQRDFSGNHDTDPQRLQDLPGPGEGDAEQQAGERGEGNSGKVDCA